jgi:hypothetical protein
MNSFRNHRLRDFSVPMSTNWLLNDLADGKRYLTDVANAETLLRLVQSVPGPALGL